MMKGKYGDVVSDADQPRLMFELKKNMNVSSEILICNI